MSESAVQEAGPKAGAARLLSDTRLSRRAAAGDQRAFAAIFRRYHQDLYRYCVAILGDSQDAQDALQNTMVKVLAALPGEQREIQLKPWLYRIAHNEAIDLRRTPRPVEPLEADVPVLTAGPAETLELQTRMRELLADIEALPDRQRGALVMRELSGLSFEQIGGAFDTSAAVARQTVYEARLSLQRMSEGREMDCAAVTKALSDGDGRLTRRRELRAHLRSCSECRRFDEGLQERERDFAVIAPLPAAAAAGLLQGLVGGGSASGGLLAGLGAATGKTVAGSVIAKSAATVAVVAVVGGAADRSGVVDLGLPGGGSNGKSSVQQSAPTPGQSDSPGQTAAPTQSPSAAGTPQLGDAKGVHHGKGAQETGHGVAGAQKGTKEGQGNAYGHQHAKSEAGPSEAKGPPAHAPGAAKEKHTGPPEQANKNQAKAEKHGADVASPSPAKANSKAGSNSQAHSNSQGKGPPAHSQGKGSSHQPNASHRQSASHPGRSQSTGSGKPSRGASRGAPRGKSRPSKPHHSKPEQPPQPSPEASSPQAPTAGA
jgi:RNA polymerase sigma factor (sigma-70 family)